MKEYFNSKELTIEVLKLIVFLVINYAFTKEIYTSDDIKLQIATIGTSIISFIIYIIVILIFKFIQKPIIIDIDIKNKVTNKYETEIIHYDRGREDSRTITISITSISKNSLWTQIALFILKNKDLKLQIMIEPLDNHFIFRPDIISREVIIEENRFDVDIKELSQSGLRNIELPFYRKYNMIVNENCDDPPQINYNFIIRPIILLNNRKPNLFSRLIIDLKDKNCFHKVEFYK